VRALAPGLVGVAGALAAEGRWREAATLFGAAEALCDRAGLAWDSHAFEWQRAAGLPEPWQRTGEPFAWLHRLRAGVLEQTVGELPPVPDTGAATALWPTALPLPIDDAVAVALALTRSPSP
jgi:hypothetical protein